MLDLESLPVESAKPAASVPLVPHNDQTRFTYYIHDVYRIVIVTILALLALIAIMGIEAGLSPNFSNPINISNVLAEVGVYGLVAVGMTFVILQGGIDLSVGPL